MAKISVKLVSPSGVAIEGLLTKNGKVCPVECSYTSGVGEPLFAFKYPPEMLDEIANVDGDSVCVDSNGQQWSLTDVLWESAPGRHQALPRK